MAMPEVSDHATDAAVAGTAVIIQHSRTEQQMVVPLGEYQLQANSRFRNWRLSERNNSFRPPTTISEFLCADDADTQSVLR